MFGSFKCTDIYDWRMNPVCNKSTQNKFVIQSMQKFYATNVLSNYYFSIGINKIDYFVIEIPHFNDSFPGACLDITMYTLFSRWDSNKCGIEIYNGDSLYSSDDYISVDMVKVKVEHR